MDIIILSILCCMGGLCAAPVYMDLRGGAPWRMHIRYLFFHPGIGPALRREFFRLARRVLSARDFSGALACYGPFFHKPMKLGRFRLKAVFSSGGAAETALLYGSLCLAVQMLPRSRAETGKRPFRAGPEIWLEPRFSSGEEFSVDCDISLSIPAAVFLYRFITLAIRRRRFGN
jgi:hypothetical protein